MYGKGPIVPVYKKGSTKVISNCKSVSVTCVISVLVWTYKIIIGHVDMRSGNFFWIWGPPQQLGAILTSCLNANVPVLSGFLSLRNGLLIFGIVCLVTLLIFLHSLHLSTQLNVSASVISSTSHNFLRRPTGIVSLTFVLLMLCYFILFYFIFLLGRLLVLYFILVAPAICYLFFLHVVFYVFLASKW